MLDASAVGGLNIWETRISTVYPNSPHLTIDLDEIQEISSIVV
jgi:hypothetical protein